MHIRRATLADRDAVYAIHVNAVRVLCASHYAPHEIEAWVGTKRNEAYRLPLSECDVFVAEIDGRVVGFGTLSPAMYEVEAVYVDPSCVRRGVGAALLREVETAARVRGLRQLRLAASLNAVPFYTACGFTAHARAMYRLNAGLEIPCVPMTKSW